MNDSYPSVPDVSSHSYYRSRHYYPDPQSSTSSASTTYPSNMNTPSGYPSAGGAYNPTLFHPFSTTLYDYADSTRTYSSMTYSQSDGGTVPGHQHQAYKPDAYSHPAVPSQQYVNRGMPASSPQQLYTPTSYPYTSPGTVGDRAHPHAYAPSQPSAIAASGVPCSPTSLISPSSSSSPTASTSQYACDICGRAFTRPHDCRRHYESHHTSTKYTCPYCNKNYARNDSLKRHWDTPCPMLPPSPVEGD